jgi:predicted DNA binding CopG/RHH family protein
MKALQKFSKQYLDQCSNLTSEEIIEFLENFRQLHSAHSRTKSRLISIKIPEPLLKAFRVKSALEDVPYQTQIKRLMTKWLNG